MTTPAPDFNPDTFAGPAIVSLEAFKAQQREWKFGPLFLDQLDDAKASGDEYEFLARDWVSVGDISIVGGARQSGKTFWALELGMCVAHNRPFFGNRVKPGLVIYQTGEGARGFKKRLRAWRKHHGIAFSRDTLFVPLLKKVDLFHTKDQAGQTEDFIAEIKAIMALYPDHALRLVIVDTLAVAHPGADEVSGRDMGLVLANVARVRDATGAHVMLVSHLNAGGSKIRGHTSLEANADTVITIVSDAQTKVRTVTLEKQKDGEAGITMQFELMSVPLGVDEEGEPITSCVALAVGQKAAVRKAEQAKGVYLKPDEERFMRHFFAVERAFGQVPPHDDERIPTQVRSIVKFSDFKRWLVDNTVPIRIMPEDAPEEDKAKAAKRHSDAIDQHIRRMGEQLRNPFKLFKFTREPIMGKVRIGEAWFMFWLGKPLRAFPHTQPAEIAPPPPTDAPDGGEAFPDF